jgi:hypothetical protein
MISIQILPNFFTIFVPIFSYKNSPGANRLFLSLFSATFFLAPKGLQGSLFLKTRPVKTGFKIALGPGLYGVLRCFVVLYVFCGFLWFYGYYGYYGYYKYYGY